MMLIKHYKNTRIEFQIDLDCPFYCEYKWNAVKRGSGFYLYNVKYNLYYHRVVMMAKSGEVVDHIDRDTTNNLSSNLRIVTQSENLQNRSKQSKKYNSSQYIGVSFETWSGKWKASININYKRKTLGRFNTEIEAAEAYNSAIKQYRPVYGVLNKILK